MATAPRPPTANTAPKSRAAVTSSVLVIMVILIFFAAWCTRKKRPVSGESATLPRTQRPQEQQQIGINPSMLQSFPVVKYYTINRVGRLDKADDWEVLGRIESGIRATGIRSLLRRGGNTKGVLLGYVIQDKTPTLAPLTGCQTNVLSVPTDS